MTTLQAVIVCEQSKVRTSLLCGGGNFQTGVSICTCINGHLQTRAATMEGWQDQSLQQHHRTDVVADGGGSSGIGVSYDYDAFISCSSF